MRTRFYLCCSLGYVVADAAPVAAGMPSASLTDAASMRLQSISFFLAAFLASALAVRWIWNAFGTDYPRMPHLSYVRSIGLVGLWGLVFVLVLTMISGARELMTPGAWKKDGITYTLADDKKPVAEPPQPGPTEDERRAKLTALYAALTLYAAQHDSRYPPPTDSSLAPDLWRVPHPTGMRYVYFPNRTPRDAGRVLACEPELFGEWRLVLFTSGEIRRMTSDQLAPLLAPEAK